jgi:hypothetical protein
VYVAFAQQARAHPGDPYGFEFYWYDAPEPRWRSAPSRPSCPTAGGRDGPVRRPARRLEALLFLRARFTGSSRSCSTLARPLATPVLFAVALGPGVLPGLNLMLDVPAVALGLLGYALFVAACERADAWLALASGLAVGLAMQTKYSAVVYPALVLAHAAIYRRPREGAIALLAAAGLFLGWEGLMLARYGQSHFLTGAQLVRASTSSSVTRAKPRRRGPPRSTGRSPCSRCWAARRSSRACSRAWGSARGASW